MCMSYLLSPSSILSIPSFLPWIAEFGTFECEEWVLITLSLVFITGYYLAEINKNNFKVSQGHLT